MNKYTVGFIFDNEIENVLLLKKNKPIWQKDKWNGIGGKIERKETPKECIQRECFEETGLSVPLSDWIPFCKLSGKDFEVYFFCTFLPQIKDWKPREVLEGLLQKHEIINLPEHVLDNVRWLIPMAIEVINPTGKEGRDYTFDVKEVSNRKKRFWWF